jgi:hypothetical protein
VLDGARSAVKKLSTPLIAGGAAVAGVAGGVVLGARAKPRKGLLNRGRFDTGKAAKQFGKAAQQFGDVTKELRKAGEQAEKVGKHFS